MIGCDQLWTELEASLRHRGRFFSGRESPGKAERVKRPGGEPESVDPRLADLFKEFPLPKAADRERAAGGDLEFALQAYRRLAASQGRQNHWSVWVFLVAKLGCDFYQQVEEITNSDRRWLALWLFDTAKTELACRVYRRFLDDPGRYGTFAADNVTYLRCLFKRGEMQQLVQTVDELEDRFGLTPQELFWACRALVALERPDDGRRRFGEIVARYHGIGESWALAAVLDLESGQGDEARSKLREAVRLGVSEEKRQMLVEAFAMSQEDWEALHSELAMVQQPWEWAQAAHAQDPGAVIVPSEGPSVHHFGGNDFEMPDCAGCGHPIRQWFCLDLTQVPALRERLPAWEKFPMLGCIDCMVQLGRHDYRLEGQRVVLENVAIDTTSFGEAMGRLEELPQQPARLVEQEPLVDPTEERLEAYYDRWEERPQVGGVPYWIQDPEWPVCRACRAAMVFVAAMASGEDFEPYVGINNCSGFQYHFACDRCMTLSVIAQNT